MKVYVDTNVLVAGSVEGHAHHLPAFELLNAIQRKTMQGCISTHGLAEFYSVITRTPFSPRIPPFEAQRILDENIFPCFEIIALSESDYRTVLRNCANAGNTSGMIFDALHLCAARKAECERIYTFNVRHFRALASEDLAGKITAP